MRRSEEFYPIRRDRERGPARLGEEPGFSAFGGSPWHMMRRMQEDMDRIFGQFFGPADLGGFAGAGGFGGPGTALASAAAQQWAPSVDISQTDREWCIEADLPGVDRDNIDVQVQDGYLTITAELRQEEGPQGEQSRDQAQNQGQQGQGQQRQYHRRERRYGYFQRVIPLPENVDEEKIACEFRQGVLTVHVPKTAPQQQQARRIPISSGGTQPGGTAGLGAAQGTAGRAGAAATGTSGTTRGRQQAEEEEEALAGAKGGERRSGEASGASQPSNRDQAAGQSQKSGGAQRSTGKRNP